MNYSNAVITITNIFLSLKGQAEKDQLKAMQKLCKSGSVVRSMVDDFLTNEFGGDYADCRYVWSMFELDNTNYTKRAWISFAKIAQSVLSGDKVGISDLTAKAIKESGTITVEYKGHSIKVTNTCMASWTEYRIYCDSLNIAHYDSDSVADIKEMIRLSYDALIEEQELKDAVDNMILECSGGKDVEPEQFEELAEKLADQYTANAKLTNNLVDCLQTYIPNVCVGIKPRMIALNKPARLVYSVDGEKSKTINLTEL